VSARIDGKAPLVLAEGWDVTFYAGEEALSRKIEPWFPSEVEYRSRPG
jgi:hypothetical protein